MYFNFNGGWFGMTSPIPGNWTIRDFLYVGMGQDGNYYLYNPQFPDVSVTHR